MAPTPAEQEIQRLERMTDAEKQADKEATLRALTARTRRPDAPAGPAPEGIAATLTAYAEPGKRALDANVEAKRAEVDEFIGLLMKRGRAVLAKHSSLRNKHLDRIFGVLAPFGAVYQGGTCPGFDEIAAALPSDWHLPKGARASISPSRVALKCVFDTARELSAALQSQLTGNTRSREFPMNAADLGDAINSVQRDLVDNPTAHIGADAIHAKLALQTYIERAEQLVGSIEHLLARLDLASLELQKLTGAAAPAPVVATAAEPVLTPVETRKRSGQQATSYQDFEVGR